MIDRNNIKELILKEITKLEEDSEKARQRLNLDLPKLKYGDSDIEMFIKFLRKDILKQ